MKNCAVCNGRKIKCLRDAELRIIVRCEKCGATVHTPYRTEDSAIGAWNTKQSEIEKKMKAEAAAS